MDWNNILNLKTWTPLRNVINGVYPVIPGVYMVGDNAYIRTQIYNKQFEINHPDAPFITMAYWVSNLDALKRCVDRNGDVIVKKSNHTPPPELLLGTGGKYGELEEKIPSELAVYKSAVYSNTGKFVHKIIEIGRYRYLYLGSKINKDDKVYAIEVSLL